MNATRAVVLALLFAPAPSAQDPAEPAISYAKVLNEVQARCFAGPKSPSYDDLLPADTVVQVGEKVGDYRRLLLPLGATGYVHKKFSSEPVDGVVLTTGSNVSFRYRAKSSEVPAMVLPKGTELMLMADAGDWWKVRHAGAPAYVADADVVVFDTQTQALVDGYREFDAQRRAEWRTAVEERAAAAAAAERRAAQELELDGFVQRFDGEQQKPTAEQTYGPLLADVKALAASLDDDGPLALRARTLVGEIERQELVVRALNAVVEPLPTRDEAAEILPPKVEDPRDEFDAIGWLRLHRSVRSGDYFTLEKGGKLMFVVTCSSGRYDLSMYDGFELGLRGGKARPSGDRVRELDVLEIRVLGRPR